MKNHKTQFMKSFALLACIVFFASTFLIPESVHADVSYYTGSFQKNTSTGDQQVTGTGFMPKILMFYYASTTSETALSWGSGGGYGFGIVSTSTTVVGEHAVTNWTDSAAASNVGSGWVSTSSILMTKEAGAIKGRATLKSFDSNGFTLNWNSTDTYSNFIHYIAIGGTDITNATTGVFTLTDGAGTQTVSGVGFQPDFLFFLPVSNLNGAARPRGNFLTDADSAMFNMGFAAATTTIGQGSISTCDEDGETASQNTRYQSATHAILISVEEENNCSNVDVLSKVTAMNSDGFELLTSDPDSSTVNNEVIYLAVKGGQWEASSFAKRGNAGPQQATTTFQSVGAFFTSFGLASTTPDWTGTGQSDAHLAIGSVDSTRMQGLIQMEDDANADTNPDARSTSTQAIMMGAYSGTAPNDRLTLNSWAELSSLGADGVDITWDTSDATQRQVLYWAVGSAASMTASGNIYESADTGTSASSACGGSTEVAVVVGESPAEVFTGGCSASDGSFNITLTGNTSLTAGTPILTYINGVADTYGTAITQYDGTGNISGLTVREGRLLISNEGTASTTDNYNLDIYDNGDDSDINYTVSSGALTVESDTKLIVSGDDTFSPRGTVTLTAGGSAPGGDLQIQSGTTLSAGTNEISVGGLFMNFGTYTTTGTTTLTGSSKSFNFGSSNTIGNLELSNSSSITASSSFRTAYSGTTYVPSNNTLTLKSGIFASSSVLAVGGTVTMSGNATTVASSTISGSGTFNSHIRFDVSTASSSLGALTTGNGANVEIYSDSSSARGLQLTGNQSIAGALLLNAAGSASVTLDSKTSDATAVVTGDIDFVGGGSGSEVLTVGTGAWTVSGNVNFSGGAVSVSVSNIFTMDGTSKTLTANSNSFGQLTLSGTITTADAVGVTATTTLSGSTITLGGILTAGCGGTISGNVYPQTYAVKFTSTGTTCNGLDVITGGGSIGSLWIDGAAILSNADLTAGTTTIGNGSQLRINTGRVLTATSSLTVNGGTLDGTSGTTTVNRTFNFPSGTINTNIRASSTIGAMTIPGEEYGGNLEIFSTDSSSYTATLSASTTVMGAFLLRADGTGDVTLAGPNAPVTIDAVMDFIGSGGGTEIVTTGTGVWTFSTDSVDFTGGTFTVDSGNTIRMAGTSKTLTTNGNSLHHFAVIGSGSITTADAVTLNGDFMASSTATLTLGSTLSVAGNVTLGGSSVLVDGGKLITLSGSSKTLDGGGETIHSLRLSGTASYTTSGNNLTISTSTIDSGATLTVGSGLTVTATSTVTLNGTIAGSGTTTFGNSSFACTNVPSGGTLSSNILVVATAGNCTLPARVFGANLGIYSASASERTATLTTGSSTVSSDLLVSSANTANITLASAATTEMHVTRNIQLINGGLGGKPALTMANGVWYANGNADFSTGILDATTASSTFIMTGSSKTLTPVSPFNNFYVPGVVSLAGNASSTGDVVFSGTVNDVGNRLEISGTSKTLSAGNNLISNLWVRGTYNVTGSNITVGTSTIDSSKSLTIAQGYEVLATSTMTLNGTIDGTGTTTFGDGGSALCTNIPSGGTLSSDVGVDATAGNCTMPARTYGGSVVAYSNSASNRTVTLAGATTISGSLFVAADSSGLMTLAGPNAAVAVTGNIDYLGSGTELITTGNNTWTVSGNVDMTGGAFTPTSGNTWVMDGSSKTLTAASGFENLTLSGSVTLGGNASSTGNVVLSGTVLPGTNTFTLAGADKTIQGGNNTLYNLTIPASASSTLSTSNISVSNTLTVAGALEVGSGRTASASAITLTGTIHGSGTTTATSSLSHSGTINGHMRFDVTYASSTMPSGTYNGNVEIYNAGATSRGVSIPVDGTATLNSALLMNAAGAGNAVLVGTSSTLTVSGAVTYIGTGAGSEMLLAGTKNWTFNSSLNTSGGYFTGSAATTTIKGNYTNSGGTFTHNSGIVDFAGTSQQTITGNATGSSAFYKLAITNTSGSDPESSPSIIFTDAASSTDVFQLTTAGSKVRLAASKQYTFQNTSWDGDDGSLVTLYSSSAGTQSTIYIPGTQQTVSYVGFKDITCGGSTTIDASNGTNNDATGNGACVIFAATNATIVSAANQIFEVGQSATAISQITVTAGTGSGLITAASDLRIAIATSTVNMRWDTSDTSAAIGGSQNCTVADTVSYEGNDSVLVVPISGSNCSNGDTITISGLAFKSFATPAPSSTALKLFLDGAADASANASNVNQYVAIKGTIVLSGHSAGQQGNAINQTSESISNVEHFAFRLAPAAESASTTSLVITLPDVNGFSCANLTSNMGLYVDFDSDGDVDASETTVGGTPTCDINASTKTGSLTFASEFATSSAHDYILRSDIGGNNPGNKVTFALSPSNITTTGTTSRLAILPTGSVSNSGQFRENSTLGGGGGGGPETVTPNETPTGGGTDPGGGGGTEGGGDGGGGSSGGGGGQGGGGGPLDYIPPLGRSFATIVNAVGIFLAMFQK